MTGVRIERLLFPLLLCAGSVPGCQKAERPEPTSFYDRRIGPILLETCANSPTQSGCHVAADNRGNALGNLNVTSYDALTKRKDLLVPYGPYLMPGLLVKALPPFQVRITTWEGVEPIPITTAIPHAGGSLVDITSTSFNEIIRWLERGATENNAVAPAKDLGRTPCSEALGEDLRFDVTTDPAAQDFDTFQSKVSSVLSSNCAAGNCHGSRSNSLYLTCGKTPEQERWNYFAAGDYVSADPESSEIVQRPLSPNAGGTYHEGGAIFSSTSDPGYRALVAWAKEKGGPNAPPSGEGFTFFAHRVQPMLVKKGCMLLGCHSPVMGHEYRLRGGSGGHFGLPATRRNYELTLEQVALDSPDPNVSRVIRKNLAPHVPGTPLPTTATGIRHRGGSLFGYGRTDCVAEDAETGDLDAQDPYCVIRRWIEIERAARMPDDPGLTGIVYVKRSAAADKDAPQDFEAFRPGADLLRAPASIDASGNFAVEGGVSILSPCGLSPGIDVRRPAVSWDGTKIAFSARASEAEPFRVYVLDGAGCAVDPDIDAAPVDDSGAPVPANGALFHNFDPTFAPDGSIVFVSTRGNVMNTKAFEYQGPQRTPADPSKLNANLYVKAAGQTGIRQLTFLLNQELSPSFMSDGRLISVTEKRAPGFYQLAARRQNLDGGDYHPLFGQRGTIGYHQLTDVVELADKNFAVILSDRGAAHGAGALAVVNRSIGVDQESDDAKEYVQDAKAKDWPNPEFFQRSFTILDGNGRVGQAGGVYRNPTPLPDGKILVSYAPDVADLGNFSGHFELYVIDPLTGQRTGPVVSDAEELLWPVAVYPRNADRGVYRSKIDEPNGATRVEAGKGDADVLFLDVPLLSSLLFQNTRSRRVLPASQSSLEVWEDLPPEGGVTSFAGGGEFVTSDDFGQLYVRRRLLGAPTPETDGSLHVRVPGGLPLVLAPLVALPVESKPARHHQREEMQFYPGETVRQGFRRDLFDGVCASCHGAVSGYDADISANPDILTQASRVLAKDVAAVALPTGQRSPQGPPFQ